MSEAFQDIVGPRIPATEFRSNRWRYLLPTGLLVIAAVLLAGSYFLPYWRMTLHAPQYPKGLHVTAYLNRLEGDVAEVDGLNHYIGMRPLHEAAQLERQTSAMLLGVLVLLIVAAIAIHSRWAALLAAPAVLFPAGFLLDLHYWLANFGTNLDPRAALSSSIKPFVPPVLGEGVIGQFRTVAVPAMGLLVATAAALLALAALWFHRRAYKPLFDARRAASAVRARAQPIGHGACVLLVPFALLAAGGTAAARAEFPTDAHFDLQVAIFAATTGDTIRVPTGHYRGTITVDRPLTLIADGRVVIDGGGQGDVLRISAADVTLRGFELRGSGDSLDRENCGLVVSAARATIEDNVLADVLIGIMLRDADGSVVRRNSVHGKPLDAGRRGDAIRLWNSHHCRIVDNTVGGARDVVIWYSTGTQIVGNAVRDGRYGLHFMYASGSVIENNRLTDNSVGIFLMYSRDILLRRNFLAHNRGPSGYGLGLKDMDAVTVEENVIGANRVGVYLDNSPQRVDCFGDFRRNVIAYNDVGLAFLPSVARNRFTENAFIENIEQLAVFGSGELRPNEFALNGRGNFWSDYAGFDAADDGVGDVSYGATSLFENLMDREPKLRLLLYSPAQQAIELAARVFPVMRPRPKITDPAPLMAPVELAAMVAVQPASSSGSALGGGLAVAAGLIWFGWRRRRLHAARAPRASASRTSVDSAVTPEWSPAQVDAPLSPPTPAPAGAPMLAIRELKKTFGRNLVVDGLDLDVAAGRAVALWGANGAGKTTVIKCILGLHRFRGSIHVAGHDARRAGKAARRLIGYVSQEQAFFDDLTARETLQLFARLKHVPLSRAAAALAWVDLSAHARKRAGQLSGGMRQRLALAVALLADPPLLLLDEPASNLDAAARRQFLDLLLRLKQGGKTILFTTHRPEEVEQLADHVVVLERGRVRAAGSPQALESLISGGRRLRLALPAEQLQPARELLARAGFEVSLNCTALWVRVRAARNAAPLALLARSGLDVERIDFETGDAP